MDNKRLYVDFHIIQTVPPSCINRDDIGPPEKLPFTAVPCAPEYRANRGNMR